LIDFTILLIDIPSIEFAGFSKELRINLLLLSLTFLFQTLLNQTKKCNERRSYKSLKIVNRKENWQIERRYVIPKKSF
jgi:hypothetical protein